MIEKSDSNGFPSLRFPFSDSLLVASFRVYLVLFQKEIDLGERFAKFPIADCIYCYSNRIFRLWRHGSRTSV
ncbi:MAG: hypothetical protein V3V31_07660 [Methylococcales bacterium]